MSRQRLPSTSDFKTGGLEPIYEWETKRYLGYALAVYGGNRRFADVAPLTGGKVVCGRTELRAWFERPRARNGDVST